VVSFTPQPPYPQRKNPWYPLDRRQGGHQTRPGRGGENKNSQPLQGIEPPITQPVAQRYTSELSWLTLIIPLQDRRPPRLMRHVKPQVLQTGINLFTLPARILIRIAESSASPLSINFFKREHWCNQVPNMEKSQCITTRGAVATLYAWRHPTAFTGTSNDGFWSTGPIKYHWTTNLFSCTAQSSHDQHESWEIVCVHPYPYFTYTNFQLLVSWDFTSGSYMFYIKLKLVLYPRSVVVNEIKHIPLFLACFV
jgi:hypothetical protein